MGDAPASPLCVNGFVAFKPWKALDGFPGLLKIKVFKRRKET
jgi:hypothetical protein